MTNGMLHRNIVSNITSFIMSLITAAAGMFLPMLTGPKVDDALINIFWGSVYGLGFLLAEQLGHFSPGFTAFLMTIFGMVIWPVVVMFVLYRTLLTVFTRHRVWVVILVLSLLAASLAYNVAIGTARGTYVEHMPLFTAFMDI